MPDTNTRRTPARSPASAKAGHSKVLRLTSYDRLEAYLRAFAGGHFGLLILVGAGGLAKSRSVRAALNGNACWIEGNATPFGMYLKLYRHRDRFVVIDDVDALYADRSGVRLLKCLCQTEEEKSVAWHSDARSLERQGIPREFTTKSRVVIISNDWKTLNKNVAALQDRGHVLLFQPDAAEVHKKAGTWFDDKEIYDWFAKNLPRVREPSLRHYVRARELKAAGMDWTEVLAVEAENKRRGSPLSCWPAPPTAAPPQGSRRSSSKAEGVGRRSSITGGSWTAATEAVMVLGSRIHHAPSRLAAKGSHRCTPSIHSQRRNSGCSMSSGMRLGRIPHTWPTLTGWSNAVTRSGNSSASHANAVVCPKGMHARPLWRNDGGNWKRSTARAGYSR